MQQRRDAAREEKANDAVATKALDDEVKKNRMKRAKSYKQRYVPTEQAEKLEASDTFRRRFAPARVFRRAGVYDGLGLKRPPQLHPGSVYNV